MRPENAWPEELSTFSFNVLQRHKGEDSGCILQLGKIQSMYLRQMPSLIPCSLPASFPPLSLPPVLPSFFSFLRGLVIIQVRLTSHFWLSCLSPLTGCLQQCPFSLLLFLKRKVISCYVRDTYNFCYDWNQHSFLLGHSVCFLWWQCLTPVVLNLWVTPFTGAHLRPSENTYLHYDS